MQRFNKKPITEIKQTKNFYKPIFVPTLMVMDKQLFSTNEQCVQYVKDNYHKIGELAHRTLAFEQSLFTDDYIKKGEFMAILSKKDPQTHEKDQLFRVNMGQGVYVIYTLMKIKQEPDSYFEKYLTRVFEQYNSETQSII